MPGTRTLWTYSNCAGHHRRDVDARHRRAEHGPLARVPAFRLRVERHVEAPAADQLAVGHTFFDAIASRRDHAVAGDQLLDRDAETRRRQLQQRLRARWRRQRQVALVEVRRVRLLPGRRALIGRERGVALNQPHAIERARAALRRPAASARCRVPDRARTCRCTPSRSIGGDRDPGIELSAAGPLSRLRRAGCAGAAPSASRRCEADDQRARPFEEARRENPARVERGARVRSEPRASCVTSFA